MNIHVADDIKEMLYEHGAVVIPGLGAFKGTYKVAAIDTIKGQIAPPSLDISFDPNIVINDGVFVDFLKKKYHTGTQDAQRAIDAFIANTQTTFEKHEIMPIPHVGRLYRDLNNKVQFLSDNTNFNVDSFGLPTVYFSPLSRTTTQTIPAAETVITATMPPPPPTTVFPETIEGIPPLTFSPTENQPWFATFNWRKWILPLTFTVLAVMVYNIYKQTKTHSDARRVAVEKVKVNVPPPKTEVPVSAAPTVKQNDNNFAHNEALNDPRKADVSTESLKPTTTQSEALILLGGFGNKNNINRHKKWLTANGYGISERQSGNITLLSAKVAYKDRQELKRIVSKLEARFGEEAVQISRK